MAAFGKFAPTAVIKGTHMSTATAATSLRLCSGSVDSNAVADSVVLSATTSSTLDAFKSYSKLTSDCPLRKLFSSMPTCFTSSTETVQKTLSRSRHWWKTLAGLAVLLGSCFRRNDDIGFLAQSRKCGFRDCAKIQHSSFLTPLAPLSGGN